MSVNRHLSTACAQEKVLQKRATLLAKQGFCVVFEPPVGISSEEKHKADGGQKERKKDSPKEKRAFLKLDFQWMDHKASWFFSIYMQAERRQCGRFASFP